MKILISLLMSLLFFLVFSCAGTPEERSTQDDDQLTEETELITEDEELLAEEQYDLHIEDNNADNEDQFDDDHEYLTDNDEQLAMIDDLEDDLTVNDENLETAENEEQISEIREQVVEIRDQLTEIRGQLAELIEQLTDRRDPEVLLSAEDEDEQIPPTVPLAEIAQTQEPLPPPAEQLTVEQPEREPVSEAPTETPAEVPAAEREPITPLQPRRDFPPAPAARTESLSQLGAVPRGEDITFSRVVRVTVGQILEIPFRGTGWVYLGELASRRGVSFSSRRNDPEGMTFIFNIEEAGVYALKFFREDFLRGYIINDHVQVIAGEAPAAGSGWFNPPFERGRVVAQPRWPSAVEEAEINRGTFAAGTDSTSTDRARIPAETPTVISSVAVTGQTILPPLESTEAAQPQTAPPETVTEPISYTGLPEELQLTAETELLPPVTQVQERLAPEVIVQRAIEAFEGGNAAAAIALLDQFMEYYPGGSDEVYWLYGQFYEANTPSRNILLSLDYYRRIIREYPQSARFNDARRRIAFLERFFINIQ